MSNLETKIESILLFKNEPVSISDLSIWVAEKPEQVREAVTSLQHFYKNRGFVLVTDGESVSFGTNPNMSELITALSKEELSRGLSRAGFETLATILYTGPISRREIDHIRGVNSGFILRHLLVRGLIERTEGVTGERSYSYKPTLKLLEYLGVSRMEDLPEHQTMAKKIEQFMEAVHTQDHE
jgi:segregation and condensation protein B